MAPCIKVRSFPGLPTMHLNCEIATSNLASQTYYPKLQAVCIVCFTEESVTSKEGPLCSTIVLMYVVSFISMSTDPVLQEGNSKGWC